MNPILQKLLNQAMEHLKKEKDFELANKFIEDRTLDWRRYCAQYSGGNPDEFIINLVVLITF